MPWKQGPTAAQSQLYSIHRLDHVHSSGNLDLLRLVECNQGHTKNLVPTHTSKKQRPLSIDVTGIGTSASEYLHQPEGTQTSSTAPCLSKRIEVSKRAFIQACKGTSSVESRRACPGYPMLSIGTRPNTSAYQPSPLRHERHGQFF